MATQTFSKSGSTITVNSYSTDNPPHYKITADDSNHLVLINADDNSFNLQVNAALDTITINGESFSGTATELRTALLADIFVLAPSGTPTVQTVYSLKTIVTDAQIKGLKTTPIELVPAPGAGKLLMFQGISVRRKPLTAIYTGLQDFDGVRVTYETGDGGFDAGFWYDTGVPYDSLSSLLFTEGSKSNDITYYGGVTFEQPNNGYYSNIQINANNFHTNKALVWKGDVSGTWSGGDPANTLEITIYYVIIDQ